VQKGQWSPQDFGVETSPIEELRGGDPETNAGIVKRVLQGEPGPARDIVLVNASAALLIGGRVPDIRTGVVVASEAIDNGSALDRLSRLAELTTAHRPQALQA
jgi:anthranilate phosphoribosyltransferase